MHRGRACFETRPSSCLGQALRAFPQHEVGSWWKVERLLILSRPPSGRLEGRTSAVQPQAADAGYGMVGSAAGAHGCIAAGARGPWRAGVFRPLGRRVLALVPRRGHQLSALPGPIVDARDSRRMGEVGSLLDHHGRDDRLCHRLDRVPTDNADRDATDWPASPLLRFHGSL